MDLRNVARISILALVLIGITMGGAQAQEGASTYQQCQGCHGADGTGTLPGQPDFTSGDFWKSTSKADLKSVVNGEKDMLEGVGGEGSGMSFQLSSEADAEAALKYAASEFGGVSWKEVGSSAGGGGESGPDGASIYSSSCASCHGQDGTGMMKGQPDFTKTSTWEEVEKSAVVSFVKEGGEMEGMDGTGNGMPADGGASLTDAERTAAVEYIMSLADGGGGAEGEGGGEGEKAPERPFTLFEEIPPHEIGFANFVVLLTVVFVMFGVTRILDEV